MKDSWSPSQYEKFKNERSEPFFDLLKLVERTSFANVVDLGCGSGELTEVLQKELSAKSVLGIDSSSAMLEKAKSFVSDTIRFKHQRIEDFKDPGKYDLIFSNAALQWCNGHETLFANLKSSLTPTGQLAIQMPMNHHYPTHVLAREIAREEPYRSFLKSDEGSLKNAAMLSPEAYATLLNQLGFKRQTVILKVYGHVLPSRDSVIEWVKGTMLTYYQSNLPPDVYDSFLLEFKQRLFAFLPDEKPFFYPFQRILLWASF